VRTTVERRALQETRHIAAANRARDLVPKFESAEHIEAIQEEVTTSRAALDEIEAALSARNADQARTQQTVARIKQFLTVEMRGPIRAAKIRNPLRKGESLSDAIVRVRDQLNAAQNELAAVKATPPTRTEIEQQLHDHIQELKNQGVPRWTLDSNNRIQIAWPDTTSFSTTGVFPAPSGGATRLLAHLFPDTLYAALCDGLEDWPAGLPAAERARRIQQLESRSVGRKTRQRLPWLSPLSC
jgi:hypothetical protein